MAYPANVERWRPIVAKYFRPEDVDKALYVINGESGGNPTIAGDGGHSIGLFQMNMAGGLGTGSTASQLSDPEYNIKLAAQAVYGGSGWGPWGEGTSYQGKKFGALGNNPYPGTNAREEISSGVSTVPNAPTKPQAGPNDNPSLGALLKLQGKPITNVARTIKSGSILPQATGNYEADAGAYFQAAQDAYDRLNNYISSSSDILQVDESSGIVAKWNSDTDAFDLVDEGATKILQEALAAQGSLDRLYNAQKAGLIKTGADSASAYLASEKERAAAASNSYDDYIKRISDLAAVEDIPNQRAANLASTISTITKNAQSTGRTYSMGMGVSGRPKGTDFGQFATSMRSAIPSAAPKPYSINPAALEPPPQSSMKFPARQPDEILSEYYGGGMPQITPGDITIGGASGGFSQIPNAGLQPVAPIPVPNVNPLTSGQITPQTIASGMLSSSRWQNRIR